MTTTSDPGPLATTTKRTTRPTADGDVAGANRTMTMRGGDAHPALDGGAGRGRGMMMPQPPPPSSHHRRRPRIIAVVIAVVVIRPPPTPCVVCHRPLTMTKRRPPPRFAFDCRFIPTPLSSLHRCPRGLMNAARAQRHIPRIHPSTPVDTQGRGA